MSDVVTDPISREDMDLTMGSQVQQRKIRPDRRKYEHDMEDCSHSISTLEAELKSLSLRGDDKVVAELRGIRSTKESTIARRKKIDMDLRALNQNISKMMDSLAKIQSNMPYRDEARIDKAISCMEEQLKTNNFRLSEEKKVVAEIDRLKRSKKALVQYTDMKREIDAMRDNQRKMREQRDRLYKEVTSLKTREEEIKRKTAENKFRAEDLKKELDELYENKRQLHTNFKKQEREYYSARDEERRKKRAEEKKQQDEKYEQALAEYEASREPFEEERQLCSTLIAYLQRYLSSSEAGLSSSQSDNTLNQGSVSQGSVSSGSSCDFENNGMYVLRKKCDDDMYCSGVRPKTKRSKREKRKSSIKNIKHTPEAFEDFAKLELEAPMTMTDVPGCLEKLQAKKTHYDNLSQQITTAQQPSILIDPGQKDHSDGSAGTPSVAESAICESMPSTPEVQLDNLPPNFPVRTDTDDPSFPADPPLRKLSHDSGAYELDYQTPTNDNLIEEAKTLCAGDAQVLLSSSVPKFQDTNRNLPSITGPNIGGPVLGSDMLGCEHMHNSVCAACLPKDSSILQMVPSSVDSENNQRPLEGTSFVNNPDMASHSGFNPSSPNTCLSSQDSSCSSSSSNSVSTASDCTVISPQTLADFDRIQDQAEELSQIHSANL